MKIAVIEDEKTTRSRLIKYIGKFDKHIKVVAELSSISAVSKFFMEHSADVDLVISDIELTDGNIIAAWESTGIRQPVIFVTAYDAFWLQAFRNTGIEYVLKPFVYDDIARALAKYLQLREQIVSTNASSMQKLLMSALSVKTYKQRLTYRLHDKIFVLPVDSVVYFTIDKGVIYAIDKSAKKHPLQYITLQELEADLDPRQFFKINRSDIVQIQYISQMKSIEGERTEIFFQSLPAPLYTSTNRNAAFKEWLNRN